MKKQLLAAVALGASLHQASALDFDFSAAFTKDNDVVREYFSLADPATVTVFTSSWDDGGFDPVLALWDSSGNLIAEWDDSGLVGSEVSNGVSYDYGSWDVFEKVSLPAGSYSVTIAQFNNFAIALPGENISLGFQWGSNPNFTFTEQFGPQPYFNGVNGDWDGASYNDPRTGNYAFHIKTPDMGSSAVLLALGLGMLVTVGRRR